MKWIYRIGVFLARIFLALGALFSPKLNHFLSGRNNLFENLRQFKTQYPGRVAWFHVASLGEYEQARPVISMLKDSRPSLQVVVSFFSPSGYDHVIKKPQPEVNYITYIPLDSRANAMRFVNVLRPELAFFVKYDLWFEHILALKEAKVPIFLFSASFRPDQNYFRSNGFFRSILVQFDYIFTQNRKSLDLLDTINYSNASYTGDTRFDRVVETSNNPKSFPELGQWTAGYEVVVAGSVWQEDMDLLIPRINEMTNYRWIIAPHDLGVEQMNLWISQLERPVSRYSEWDRGQQVEIIIIDNIGMLSSLYQFAKIAYIGGAFGKGLHNILEPLGFAVPVVFGNLKKSAKFPEAEECKNLGCGFEVSSAEELKEIFEKLDQQGFYSQSVSSARSWVKSNVGAAEKIVSMVNTLTSKS